MVRMIEAGSRVRVVSSVSGREASRIGQVGLVRQVASGDDPNVVACLVVFDSDGSEAWFWIDELEPA